MVWGIKQAYILTNFLLFRLVFSLFRLFQNTETPCFDLKRNHRNKRLVSDSAETSFGCFNTKLVSEDTLILASYRQKTGSPKYTDVTLLI
jgi:hypothetical protein